MTDRREDCDIDPGSAGVNPGYAAFQIARALTTSEEHEDPEARERARERISKWEGVLRNILTGSVAYGSRTPVAGVAAWATLEVVTGGFATGALLAGGSLQEYETALLQEFGGAADGQERLFLNSHFLTDAGLERLRGYLRSGCYDIGVPEEGALLVVAWLVENGSVEEARSLIEALAPWFSELRFYPIPLAEPRRFGSRVHLQTVGETLRNIRAIGPNQRILAQKEAVDVWTPLYDRVVALFLETVEDDWPCRHYPGGWRERAFALLGEYAELRKEHGLCGKMERANRHCSQLKNFLGRCAREPQSLNGREVGRIRLILRRYLEKRGPPDSTKCAEARRRQKDDVSAPLHHRIAEVVAARLERHSMRDGLDDISHLAEAVGEEESASTGVPRSTRIPPAICRKVERCLSDTAEILIERGLITSGDTLARVLPQMTSGLQAAGITDPTLRQLYAAIYRAFRRRRSLLLLDLEKQVQIEELPWVAAIDRFRSESLSSRELARQTLEELTVVTLTAFPHAILPNKLLQEMRALVTAAGLDIPLVDELAADIFMGQFSGKFVESAKRAATLLAGSIYATYYGIDYEGILRIRPAKGRTQRKWIWQPKVTTPDVFAQLCAGRAGVFLGTWDPATNGMIIEQQQILTTQNLAALFAGLDLSEALRDQLEAMARRCFTWICRRQQVKTADRHARLIVLKNTAYAWRQMIFFLALLPGGGVADFLRWATGHLQEQGDEYRDRFGPALKGLPLAADGHSLDSAFARRSGARRFLGWSKTRHWLLPAAEGRA